MKQPLCGCNQEQRNKSGIWETHSYLLFLLMPLILGVVLYFATRTVVEKQIKLQGELTVREVQTRISSMLKEAEIVADAIRYDSDFRENSNAEEVTSKSISYVLTSLGANSARCDFIDKIYVIDEKQEKIYSNDGAVHSMDSLDSILKNNNLSGIDYRSISGWSGTLYNDYSPPIYICDISSEDNERRIGSMLVLLRRTDFLRMLYTADAECLCLFHDSLSIHTALQNAEEPDWKDADAVSAMLGKKVECIYAEDDNFTYMVAISVNKYHEPLQLIFYFFVVYIILVMAIGIVNLYLMSKKRRQRVESILSTFPKDVAVGSTDEEIMNSVQEALERYRQKDKSAQERSRAAVMRHILQGHYRTVSRERLAEAGIPEAVNGCYVVTLFMQAETGQAFGMLSGSGETEEQDVIDVIFHSVLKKMIGERAKAASVEIYPNYVIVVCPSPGEDRRQIITEIISEFLELLENRYGFLGQAMVSQDVSDMQTGLDRAYAGTEQLYNFVRTIDSDKKLIFKEDLEEGQGNLLNGDYLKQIQILTNTLIAEKYSVIPPMVESILHDYVTPLRKDYLSGQRRLNNITNLLMEALRVSNAPGLDKDDAIERIRLSNRSVSSLNAATAEVFDMVARLQDELPETEDPVSKACIYIKENLSDGNLTVPFICETVGISVQHLSRLFRQKKDTTIMDYLNQCRINRSKKLLEDKTLTVAFIAGQVGYNSTETYTRNFRRREGLTPTEYRNLHYKSEK